MEKIEFVKFKSEILKRAKESNAWSGEYKKTYTTESFSDLFKAISDNFYWCCKNKVIDCKLLTDLGLDICHENNFWVNESSGNGFLIVDSATVRASGSATVRASDSATVRASGSAYINSYSSIEHKISDRAILRYYYDNKIIFGENIKH